MGILGVEVPEGHTFGSCQVGKPCCKSMKDETANCWSLSPWREGGEVVETGVCVGVRAKKIATKAQSDIPHFDG